MVWGPELKKTCERRSPVGPCESGLRPVVPCGTCQSKQDWLWGGVEPRGAWSGLPSSYAHMRLTAVTSALCRPGPCPRMLTSTGVGPNASYRMTAGEGPGRGRAGGWGEEGNPVEGAREPTHVHNAVEGPGPGSPSWTQPLFPGWVALGKSVHLSGHVSFSMKPAEGQWSRPPGAALRAHETAHTQQLRVALGPPRFPDPGPQPGTGGGRELSGQNPRRAGGGPPGRAGSPALGRSCAAQRQACTALWGTALGTGAWPPDAPRGLLLHLPPSCGPRSLWAPVTSTVEPGHLPSRDRPGSPGSGPRCPFSPDGADGSWHMSGTPLLQTRGSHQAYPLSSLWGSATISSMLQMRKLRLRERCQGPAKPPPPSGTGRNLSLPTAASSSRCPQATAPHLLPESSHRPPPHWTLPRTPSVSVTHARLRASFISISACICSPSPSPTGNSSSPASPQPRLDPPALFPGEASATQQSSARVQHLSTSAHGHTPAPRTPCPRLCPVGPPGPGSGSSLTGSAHSSNQRTPAQAPGDRHICQQVTGTQSSPDAAVALSPRPCPQLPAALLLRLPCPPPAHKARPSPGCGWWSSLFGIHLLLETWPVSKL